MNSSSTRASQSENDSQNAGGEESLATTHGGVDREFGFDSHEWSCVHNQSSYVQSRKSRNGERKCRLRAQRHAVPLEFTAPHTHISSEERTSPLVQNQNQILVEECRMWSYLVSPYGVGLASENWRRGESSSTDPSKKANPRSRSPKAASQRLTHTVILVVYLTLTRTRGVAMTAHRTP